VNERTNNVLPTSDKLICYRQQGAILGGRGRACGSDADRRIAAQAIGIAATAGVSITCASIQSDLLNPGAGSVTESLITRSWPAASIIG